MSSGNRFLDSVSQNLKATSHGFREQSRPILPDCVRRGGATEMMRFWLLRSLYSNWKHYKEIMQTGRCYMLVQSLSTVFFKATLYNPLTYINLFILTAGKMSTVRIIKRPQNWFRSQTWIWIWNLTEYESQLSHIPAVWFKLHKLSEPSLHLHNGNNNIHFT